MFDIITFGSATVDVFIKTKSKQIDFSKLHGHENVCLPIGSKILIDQMHTSTGGGGTNTAVSFSRLGLKTAWAGILGKGNNSRLIKHILKTEKITFLGKEKQGDAGFSIILTNLKNNRTILAYKGINNNLDIKDIKKANSKWIYCGSLLGKSLQTLFKYVKTTNANIAFNPSTYLAMKGIKYLKPLLNKTKILILNKEEAEYLTKSKKDVKTLLKILNKTIPIVVITDGEKGAYCFDGKKTLKLIPYKIKILETTGAGDSFASAFVAAYINKKPLDVCLQWGYSQASSVISHLGAKEKLLKKSELLRSKKAKVIEL